MCIFKSINKYYILLGNMLASLLPCDLVSHWSAQKVEDMFFCLVCLFWAAAQFWHCLLIMRHLGNVPAVNTTFSYCAETHTFVFVPDTCFNPMPLSKQHQLHHYKEPEIKSHIKETVEVFGWGCCCVSSICRDFCLGLQINPLFRPPNEWTSLKGLRSAWII